MKKRKVGRPSSYKPEYCKKIVEFFDVKPYRIVEVSHTNKKGDEWITTEERANDMIYIEDFAHKIGVTHKCLLDWVEKYPEFSSAYARAKEMQWRHLSINGLKKLYEPSFARYFGAVVCGKKEEQNVNLNVSMKMVQLNDLNDTAKS